MTLRTFLYTKKQFIFSFKIYVFINKDLHCRFLIPDIFNVDEFKKGVMERVNKEVEEAKSKGNTTGANQIGISLSVGI